MSDTTDTKDLGHVLRAFVELLRPTKGLLLFYIFVSVFILLSSRLVWFLDMVGISSGYFEVISDKWIELDNKFDFASYWNPISNALLWFALGSILYLLFWTIIVSIVDGYNDIIVSTRFMHPRSFHQSDYWTAIAGRALVRIAGFGLFLVLFLWGISGFLSSIYNRAYTSWSADSIVLIAAQIVIVFILVSLVLHGMTVGLRIGLLKLRIL